MEVMRGDSRCARTVLMMILVAHWTASAVTQDVPLFQVVRTRPDPQHSLVYVRRTGLLAKKTSFVHTNDTVSSGIIMWQVVDQDSSVVEAVITSTGRLIECHLGAGDRAQMVTGLVEGEVRRILSQQTEAVNHTVSDFASYSTIGKAKLPQVQWLKDLPADYVRFVLHKNLAEECRQHLRRLRNASSSFLLNANNSTADIPHIISRRRRDSGFIFPGTKWCGDGSEALSRPQIGRLAGADRCCRHHDHCPLHIKGFSEQYELFNYSFFTLSHCNCDLRFHTCLKMINSSAANMIGNIFFNVVRTKCFILKKKRKCAVHNWWGNKCEKYKTVKQAYLKEPLYY